MSHQAGEPALDAARPSFSGNIHKCKSRNSLWVGLTPCYIQARLEAMGSHYGALPAHDALWHSAEATAHSLPARLAVEHCVHEARGCALPPSSHMWLWCSRF